MLTMTCFIYILDSSFSSSSKFWSSNENFCLTHNPNDRDAFNCWSINRSSFNFGHGVISMYSGHKLRLEFDLKFVRKSPCDTKIRHILHTPRIRVTQILKFSHLLLITAFVYKIPSLMRLLVLGKSRTSPILKKSHMYLFGLCAVWFNVFTTAVVWPKLVKTSL